MSVDRLKDIKYKRDRYLNDGSLHKSKDLALNIDDNVAARDVDLQVEIYKSMDALMDDIDTNCNAISALTAEQIDTSDPEARKRTIAQADSHIQSVTRSAMGVKNMFVQIKEDNAEFNKKPENAHSARAQVRQNLYEVHVRRFQEAMIHFGTVREQYRSRLHSRISSMLKNVDENITNEQIDDLIESGGVEQHVAQKLASDELKEVVDDLRARNKAFLQLQKSVEGLYQMFKDLNVLIELQGESINVIDSRIERALDYTKKGQVELEKAQEYQKKARKCQCQILIILLFILAILAVPVVIEQT